MHHDYWAHGPQLESSSATTERLCMTQRYGVPQPRLEAAKNKFINKKYLSFPMSEWKHGAVLVSACLMHLGSASGWLSRSAEFGWAYIGEVRWLSVGLGQPPRGTGLSSLWFLILQAGSHSGYPGFQERAETAKILEANAGNRYSITSQDSISQKSLKARTCGINSQCIGLESKQATSYSSL